MQLCQVGKESDIRKYHLKWLFQEKKDGCRCIALCDEQVKLIGRSGSDYTSKFPEITEELKGFKGVFDGEIACLDFDKTASRVHTENKLKSKLLMAKYPAVFYIFDEIKGQMLIERIKGLVARDFKGFKHISLLPYTLDGVGLWERAKRENWEGIIIKNPLSKYENKRSWNWIKVKKEHFKDVKFTDFEINPAGIRIENKEGIAIQVAGFQSFDVKKRIEETGSCICEVKYLEETKSGMLRQPVFSKLKDEHS